ncbi:MAG: methyltransferase domain-containing protein, partial [bacterium]|nr:methyltransferase domain-containing protein [bacterium]
MFHEASLDTIPLEDGSMDFGYCLGVLHYVPDAQQGIISCVKKLKRGAPLLVYVYYAFENRPLWFRVIWRVSDILRRIISHLPFFLKYWITWVIAAFFYFPIARISLLLEKAGLSVENIPLSAYRRRTFYTMH